MNKNKGFTLIELLVVIAIIGILSSVVLASLSNARNKGKDASIKSQLSSMKAQGELYYSTAETYIGVCAASAEDNGFALLLEESANVSGVSGGATYTAGQTAGAWNLVTCHEKSDADGNSSWAAEAPLSDSAEGVGKQVMYCVDSSGVSKVNTGVDTNLAIDDTDC